MATPDMLRVVDSEERELARVDGMAHECFGWDESKWMPWHKRAYVDAINTVHYEFHTPVAEQMVSTATRPFVDAEQDELATVDAAYTRAFGPDMGVWDPETRALYDDALRAVYRRYPQEVTP